MDKGTTTMRKMPIKNTIQMQKMQSYRMLESTLSRKARSTVHKDVETMDCADMWIREEVGTEVMSMDMPVIVTATIMHACNSKANKDTDIYWQKPASGGKLRVVPSDHMNEQQKGATCGRQFMVTVGEQPVTTPIKIEDA